MFSLGALVTTWYTASTAPAQTGPVVWVAPSLYRVGPSDPAGSGTAQVYAAKGEYESFQIVVRAPSAGLTNVNVTISDLQGPGGSIIPKSSLTLYRQHYVWVSSSSPDWGGSNRPRGAGWYADGLIPFNDPVSGLPLSGAALDAVPFGLNGNQNQPIWVDVLVPRNASAGQYTGTFTVTSDQGSASGSVALNVWNFAIPMVPTMKSSFLLWQSDGLQAQQELLRHRLSPLKSNAVDQRSLIDNLGLGGVGVPFWSGADIGNCTMSPAPSALEFQAAKILQQPDLDVYDYSADEIGQCTNLYDTVRQWGRNMHQAGVKNLVTMAPTPYLLDDGSGTGRSAVDLWVVLPVMHDNSASYVAQALQKGDSVWSYNTLVQDSYSPKWTIDFDTINFRIQPGFINQSLGLSGLLYWRLDRWASNAWNDVNNTGQFSSGNYPGEGILLYPGQQVGIQGVAPSIRLKWLRDGVDDFEYVAILKNLGRSAWALQLSRTVGADWSNWTRDPLLLESVRRQMGTEIERLVAPPPPPPPSSPSNPSPANAATGVGITAALSWAPGSGATSYDVHFGTSAAPPFVTTVTTTSYAPGTLANGTTYYWRVVAKNASGTASSPTWPFTTLPAAPPPPSSPTNLSPPNSATGVGITAALSWASGSGATSYDVHFGTSAAPPFVTTVTTTSYAPGTLANGTTYYWRVVAKNASGTASSPTWPFTTLPAAPAANAAPVAVAVNPSGGTGYGLLFRMTYSDANTAADLVGAGVLINNAISGAGACWFYYEKSSNLIWLADDTASNWQSMPLGASSYLKNSQCTIFGATADVGLTGNTLTLAIPIRFRPAFAGSRTFYLYAQDQAGLSSGFTARGSWTVP